MIKFVSFESTKFSKKFIVDEVIGFILILVGEKHWVSQMHGLRLKSLHRKDTCNLLSNAGGDTSTEVDGGFFQIRRLT